MKPELPDRFPNTHAIDMARTTNPLINLHVIHPPAFRLSPSWNLNGKGKGGTLLHRRDREIQPLWGDNITPPFSKIINVENPKRVII